VCMTGSAGSIDIIRVRLTLFGAAESIGIVTAVTDLGV